VGQRVARIAGNRGFIESSRESRILLADCNVRHQYRSVDIPRPTPQYFLTDGSGLGRSALLHQRARALRFRRPIV
jgi:hypothetical protein